MTVFFPWRELAVEALSSVVGARKGGGPAGAPTEVESLGL